jgi:hypothetical protein
MNAIEQVYAHSFSTIHEVSTQFAEATLGMESVATLMASIGMALLTILVPFAIAILSNFLRWESEKREDAFLALDLHVVLERIFVLKTLLSSAALIFIPTLFWVALPESRLIGLLLWASGVTWLTIMIYHVYEWRTIHDLEIRFTYLTALKDPVRMKVVWPSVWVAARMDDANERRYLTIFSEKVTELLKDGKFNTAIFLLDNFYANLSNRFDLSLFVGERSFFDALLGWNQQIFEELSKREQDDKGDSNTLLALEHTERILNDLNTGISRSAIGKRHSFWYFNTLYTHAQGVEGDVAYRRSLMSHVAPVLLEEAYDRRGKGSVWEGFPDAWKITLETLRDDEETVADLWREEVVAWIIKKVQNPEVVEGRALSSIVGTLFPEADPDILLRAFIVAYASHEKGEGRIASVLNTPWTFGFIRPHTKEGSSPSDRSAITAQLLDRFRELAVILSSDNVERMRQKLAESQKDGSAGVSERADMLSELFDLVDSHRS